VLALIVRPTGTRLSISLLMLDPVVVVVGFTMSVTPVT
jgi:hypothetical protein